jgi:acid ceramidase
LINDELEYLLGEKYGVLAVKLLDSTIGLFSKTGMAFFSKELESVAKRLGVGAGILLIIQISYELFASCTSVVAQDEDGNPYHVRIMDWMITYLKEFTIEVDFQRNKKTVYKATTWAGYIGILTGMKPEKFSVSINFREVGESKLKNIWKSLIGGWPVGYLVRMNLERADSYEYVYYLLIFSSAIKSFKTSQLIAPCYIIVCGVKKDEGCLITRNRDKSEHFISLDSLKSKENPDLEYLPEKDGFIICTNDDWWKIPKFTDEEDMERSTSKSRTLCAIDG